MSEAQHTSGPWRIPGANVFMVVAPEAPHTNKREGLAPPYEWAIVCHTEPDSVPPEQAAANARLIAAAPRLAAALNELVELLEPLEAEGRMNIPGLATLNRYRAALREAGVTPAAHQAILKSDQEDYQ